MNMDHHVDDDDGIPAARLHVGTVLGIWLSGVFAASLGGRLEARHEGVTHMLLLGTAVVWPVLYFALSRCRFVPRPLPFGATTALLLFGLAAALSSFGSPVMFLSAGYLVLTFAGIWLALQFNSNLDAAQFGRGLRVFVILTTGLLLGFAWYDHVPGQRLGMGKELLNPNAIALVAASVLLAAMVIRSIVLRSAVMALIGGVIVLTGSRAAVVAAMAGLGMIVWLRLRARGRPVVMLAVGGLLLAVGASLAYGDVIYAALDRFFLLSAADRGIGSGATGRITAWKATWDLFTRNPVLGVGFRAHEHLLKVDTSAHNGYLATLAEVGLFGFLGVFYLTIRGLRLLLNGSRKSNTWFGDSVLFGLCVTYLLLAIFERYLINVGNPTSLLFLLSIMRPGGMQMSVADAGEQLREPNGEGSAGDPLEPVYGMNYR